MIPKPSMLVLIGVKPEIQRLLASTIKNSQSSTVEFDLEILKSIDPPPSLILASASTFETTLEMGNALRSLYRSIPIYLVSDQIHGFERKDFIKNGFSDAFLIPVDTHSLKVALSEAIAAAGSSAQKVYRSVKLLDLDPGEALDFDTNVFFPVNNKYVKISESGDVIDAEMLEKIKKNKINNLHIPSQQIQRFYEYTGKKLRNVSTDKKLSATERKEKLTVSVRELMSGMFSEHEASLQSGQEVLKTCSGIVSSYIVQGAESEWFLRIQQVTGDFGDNYSHASNVSTLAALFSMGMGIGKVEDLALAGLLHDMGKSQLSVEIQSLESEDLTGENLEAYKKHPEMSVNMIKQKKIVVPDIVIKIILQHHELYNGTGFPNGIYGDRICKEAQILALADKFDHLTKIKSGHRSRTPSEAIRFLKDEQTNDPSKIKFEPNLLKKLLELFPVE